MLHLVFVYGTLKKGFPNHAHYMASAGFLGRYQTLQKYPLVLFGSRHVPGMLDRPGDGHHIEGELYEVNDECLGRMDVLEGINEPDGYRRRTISVTSMNKAEPDHTRAYAYLLDPQLIRDIRSSHLSVYDQQAAASYEPRTKV
jgi:gamma-glutamylaminecyclotransferase